MNTELKTNLDVEAGNRVIAEFDGWPFNHDRFFKDLSYTDEDGCFHESCISVLTRNYHSDWNLLMGVWKKVGKEMYAIRKMVSGVEYHKAAVLTQHILNALRKADINSVFLWIVEAIKWLNTINQKQVNL